MDDILKFEEGNLSLIQEIEQKAIMNFVSKLDDCLEKQMILSLNELGFQFDTKDGLFEFVKNRVHRLGARFGDGYYEYYLDFVDENNKGTYLFSYYYEKSMPSYDSVNFKINGEIIRIIKK